MASRIDRSIHKNRKSARLLMVGYAFLFSFMKQASAENLTLTQDESLRDGMQMFKHQSLSHSWHPRCQSYLQLSSDWYPAKYRPDLKKARPELCPSVCHTLFQTHLLQLRSPRTALISEHRTLHKRNFMQKNLPEKRRFLNKEAYNLDAPFSVTKRLRYRA